jgi:GT2 family glycosyltransferase
MDLSIIILNYKTKGLLKQCLKGIKFFSLPLEYEIIIVDNASGDGTEKMIRDEFSQVKFIQAGVNRGFSAGYNLGMKEARGKYFLLLNPDIAVLDKAILGIYEFMEANLRVGLAGPKLLNPDGTVQMSIMKFPTFFMPIYRRTFLGKIPWIKNRVNDYLMVKWDHGASGPADWVLGGCIIVRKEAIDEVGLLDERFFLYFDDTDWCRRFWQSDWQVYYIAHAEMVHYHRRESAESPVLRGIFNRTTREHIKSWIRYFLKYRRKFLPEIKN